LFDSAAGGLDAEAFLDIHCSFPVTQRLERRPAATAIRKEETLTMSTSGRLLATVSFCFGIGLLGVGTTAQASLQLKLSEDGGAVTTVTDTSQGTPNRVSFNGTVGDFTISVVFASSNAPGTPSGARILLNVNDPAYRGGPVITNNASGGHTLDITVIGDGFTAPNSPPPLNLTGHASGRTLSGTMLGGDFVGKGSGPGGSAQTPILQFAPGGSFSGDTSLLGQFSPNGSYSLTSVLDMHLGGGAKMQLTGDNVQATPAIATPEPATLAMALCGLPVLATWLLRRKKGA
jgi:hypothetical protein